MKNKKLLTYAAAGAASFILAFIGGNGFLLSVLFGVLGAALFALLKVFSEKKRRSRESVLIEMDMSDYLTTVAMLLMSGTMIWDAMRRAAQGHDPSRPLYRELGKTFDEIDQSRSSDPVLAFEKLADRCGTPSVSMLSGIIIQNYKKGTGEIANLMNELSVSFRESRKLVCNKLADEASTLLLIPSTIVLICLMALLMTPALLTLTGI